MNEPLRLKTRIYKGKDYQKYINDLEDSSDPDNAWKYSQVDPPQARVVEILLYDIKTIKYAIQSISMDEMENNPENPKLDSVEVYLSDDSSLMLAHTLEEYETLIKQYLKNNKL